jgi:hypothetical protein
MDTELDSTTAPEPVADPATETAPADAGSTAPAEGTEPAQQQDTFFDPKQLAPELQVHWKKMQGAYTKKMQQAADWRQKADLVDRFNTDPNVRRQILQQYANELSQAATPQAQAPQANSSTMPPEFVQAFKANLPPELQWMAEGQAKSFWQAQQIAMQPYLQAQQQQVTSTRATEWDELAQQLPPGWEEHEDDMADVLTFLESPALRHPTFGSKLQLLYKLATGDAQATTNAIERMGAAVQNRVNGRGGAGQRVEQNLTDRIMKTRSIRDAVQIAGRAAMEKLEGQGARFDG